jgi:hypothetical protein
MFGYTYLAEKRRMKKLNKALQTLESIPGWSLKVARGVYPDAKGKDLKIKAAEYEVYVEDIEDNKSGVNAVLLRRHVEQVERLAQLARKAEAAVTPGIAGLGTLGMGLGGNPLLIGGLVLAAVTFGPKLLKMGKK